MKLLAVLLMSVLAYATDESGYVKFYIDFLRTADNEWISIENKGDEASRIDILQEITGDDWMVDYDVFVDSESLYLDAKTPLCGPANTTQDVNIINTLRQILSIENQSCPIQPQSITNPKGSLSEHIEVDNYHDPHMRVSMKLSKGDLPILLALLAAFE